MAACGSDFTVAVTEDGELFAWGEGRHGHLGLGAVLHQQQPARAGGPELFDNQHIRLAAAGESHLAVMAEDGAVYTCGHGGDGRRGRRRAAAAAADAGAAGAVCGLARRHGDPAAARQSAFLLQNFMTDIVIGHYRTTGTG
jgi:hypothetical protein